MEDDRTPEADIIFYKSGPEQGYTLLEAGMFGFYAPEDGHMPCIAVIEPQPATKIVFKIPVKEMCIRDRCVRPGLFNKEQIFCLSAQVKPFAVVSAKGNKPMAEK